MQTPDNRVEVTARWVNSASHVAGTVWIRFLLNCTEKKALAAFQREICHKMRFAAPVCTLGLHSCLQSVPKKNMPDPGMELLKAVNTVSARVDVGDFQECVENCVKLAENCGKLW